jgi:hypothetical protein
MFKNNNNIFPVISKEKRNLNLYPFHKIIGGATMVILADHFVAIGKIVIDSYMFCQKKGFPNKSLAISRFYVLKLLGSIASLQ